MKPPPAQAIHGGSSRRRGVSKRGKRSSLARVTSRKKIFTDENVSPTLAPPQCGSSKQPLPIASPTNCGLREGELLLANCTPKNPSISLEDGMLRNGSESSGHFFNSQCDVVSSTPIASRTETPQGSFLTTPSKGTPNTLLLSNWGLPAKVLDQYAQRGIRTMFEWQAECLMLPNVLSGGNLVFSAPTSAGKTLVAELLALKCVLETKKKVIIILPFVSIAHEKSRYLQAIFEPQGVRVGGFMGNQSPPGGFAAVDIAICTIEKANSLINRLLEERSTHNLGAVVVDELHMIGDNHRGYLLELLLTKLMYTGKAGKNSSQLIQIIGMSATLPNISTLARWLGAALYVTEYRPTPLQEMVKIGPTLYDTNFRKIREYDPADFVPGDEDNILRICQERIFEGHSVLIFCPTKVWCENLASTLAESQAGFVTCPDGGGETPTSILDHQGLIGVCEQLRRTQVGLDHILAKTLPGGVAFHHAGLTFEEREIIEGAFRKTLIKVLVATSTLSSGVNLPARLVIVRTPFFQRSLVDILVYKQMVGRAGRKGVDEMGESILMCKPSEKGKVIGLFKSAPKLVRSCLCSHVDSKRSKNATVSGLAILKRAVLEIIANNMATTRDEIQLYASCTLYFAELETAGEKASPDTVSTLNGHLDATITFLLENDFISTKLKPDPQSADSVPDAELYPTQLGVATIASSLSPDEAMVVFQELRKARKNFVLENELHMIYLVTPVYIQEQWPNIDWYKYLCLWERLPADMRHVSDTLGVRESFLAQAVHGRVPERTQSQQESHRVHRRFFTALALHDLVHEVPIRHVARQYGATKGLLQTLQSAAGTFAGMVTVFCNRLGWTNLELLVSQFQSRLMFGVERELCELVRISLLNGFRARILYNAGYHTLAALATANPILIETCLRNAIPFKSYKLTGGGEGGGQVQGAEVSSTWCSKLRKGMTESEAASAIVSEAREILSSDLNIPSSAWEKQSRLLQSPANVGVVQPKPRSAAAPTLGVRRKSPTVFGAQGREEAGFKKLCVEVEVNNKPTEEPPQASPKRQDLIKDSSTSTGHGDDGSRGNETEPARYNFFPASTLGKVSADVNSEIDNPTNLISPRPTPPPLNPRDPPLQSSSTKGDIGDVLVEKPVFNLSPITLQDFMGDQPNGDPKGVTSPERSAEVKQLSFHDADVESEEREDSIFENMPCTIPDSFLGGSANASMNFSFQTLAMIDAACDAEVPAKPVPDSKDGGQKLSELNHSSLSPVYESSVLVLDSRDSAQRSRLKSPLLHSTTSQTPSKSLNMSKSFLGTPQFHPSCLKELSSLSSSQLSQSGLTLINVTSNQVLFGTFISECLEQRLVAFSVAHSTVEQSDGIGSVVVKAKSASGVLVSPRQEEQVVGVAFCWGGMDVYYVSLCQDSQCDSSEDKVQNQDSISLEDRITALRKLFDSTETTWAAYDMKKHARYLACSCGTMPSSGKSMDPVVASWMLNPDAKEKTIHKMILQYLPDQPLLPECEDYEEVPLSCLATNGSDPEMQASAESILACMLTTKLEALLEAEGLRDSFIKLEMPSLVVLAKMEVNGIGFSPDECANQRDILQKRVSELESEAYSLASHTFSLSSPEDVASVLFLELKLPSGSDTSKQHRTLGTNTRRVTKKRVQHLSTAKDVLEKMKSLHPLPGVVLEWRRISSAMSKTVYPLFKEAVAHEDLECYRIHANVGVHTATGRVAMSDPSLQMVPKEFDIGSKTSSSNPPLLSESQCLNAGDSQNVNASVAPSSVCMRNVFQPFPGGIFLTADYSQLELRILAHMSGDAKLKRFLNGKGDVFKMIAGEWLGVEPSDVTSKQRQDAKQVCYGMIYGIGSKALGEQLGITDDDASQFMETFKSKYPTMKKFLSKTVQNCRDNGFVTTLLGRKRFLPGIHSTNIHARSQAERQAVNSTIQGSAADLVKTAMVNIDRQLAQECGLSATCLLPSAAPNPTNSKKRQGHSAYLVLQLHDELLYEVPIEDLEHMAKLIQFEMENALELSVRFPVKIQSGYSWGRLEPLSF